MKMEEKEFIIKIGEAWKDGVVFTPYSKGMFAHFSQLNRFRGYGYSKEEAKRDLCEEAWRYYSDLLQKGIYEEIVELLENAIAKKD